jgi:hypothetical protein
MNYRVSIKQERPWFKLVRWGLLWFLRLRHTILYASCVRFYDYGRRRQRRGVLTRAALPTVRISWLQLIAAFRAKHKIKLSAVSY